MWKQFDTNSKTSPSRKPSQEAAFLGVTVVYAITLSRKPPLQLHLLNLAIRLLPHLGLGELMEQLGGDILGIHALRMVLHDACLHSRSPDLSVRPCGISVSTRSKNRMKHDEGLRGPEEHYLG